jgi:hypothetical protein
MTRLWGFANSSDNECLVEFQLYSPVFGLLQYLGPETTSGPNVIKLFTVVIFEICKKIDFFVHGNPFQSSLMFVGNARCLPLSGAPERCFAWVGSSFTWKTVLPLTTLACYKNL